MKTYRLNTDFVEERCAALGVNSRAELARRIDMHPTHLGRILDGKRPAQASHIKSLAWALNCNRLSLIGPDDPDAVLASLDTEDEG